MAIKTLDEVFKPREAAELLRFIDRLVGHFATEYLRRYEAMHEPVTQATPVEQVPVIDSNTSAALCRGFNLAIFSESDLAYYLDMPEGAVRYFFKNMGVRPTIKGLSSVVKYPLLNCSEVSQIYHGYYEEEKGRQRIATSLGLPLRTVTEAIMKSSVISPMIVDGLKTLYGIPDIDKPYKIRFTKK